MKLIDYGKWIRFGSSCYATKRKCEWYPVWGLTLETYRKKQTQYNAYTGFINGRIIIRGSFCFKSETSNKNRVEFGLPPEEL